MQLAIVAVLGHKISSMAMSLPKCNKETCSNVPFLAVGIPKYTDCKDCGRALAPCYASASPALSLVETLSNKAADPTHTL